MSKNFGSRALVERKNDFRSWLYVRKFDFVFSSGENVAPPTRVVAMNCSIVYCLTGTGLSGLGLGVCAKSKEGANAAARRIVSFMFALVALQFRVFNIFSISARRRFPSDFQNF